MTKNVSNILHDDVLKSKAQGAFLGAAMGDALGWPQEGRSRQSDRRSARHLDLPAQGFRDWVRRAGGKFFLHDELIRAGEYSDDTQLAICTARSLLHGTRWWDFLTRQELPLWSLYERGGGGATKLAANSWLAGHEPWLQPQQENVKRYFAAGGNGVAMRILPHCLFGLRKPDFGAVARDIVANGVSTHGHPRALVGALAYGFAVWLALKHTDTLAYGAIIEGLLAECDSWSSLPDVAETCRTWKPAADKATAAEYAESWQSAVGEMRELLDHCGDGMRRGALSLDQEVLERLGCFDRRVSGAGTVAAAASVFLASRYAADPFHGIMEAAFAYGADTDTIASMTGALVGAVGGIERLGGYTRLVQDASYVSGLAEKLVEHEAMELTVPVQPVRRITKSDLEAIVKALLVAGTGDSVPLPDGRTATVADRVELSVRSKTARGAFWKVLISDGQSMYVKKISRDDRKTAAVRESPSIGLPDSERELRPTAVVKIGVKLPVKDMARSVHFYSKVLGLVVTRESRNYVTLAGMLSLVSPDYQKTLASRAGFNPSKGKTILYIRLRSLDAADENLRRVGARILHDSASSGGQRSLICLDPDDNVVELHEDGANPRAESDAGRVATR